ncbi:hypothetical protein TASIC1_0011036000 [Trichoderma asperellum]|uniref:Uncharacterized protein n=1 Tax=Trichoderma asperellum TaxID=101201 RepID=A0A6V8R8R4_TRIAP|nr:hypothetical protein TASIC1_0011036000 [Trichoderma asperellum]
MALHDTGLGFIKDTQILELSPDGGSAKPGIYSLELPNARCHVARFVDNCGVSSTDRGNVFLLLSPLHVGYWLQVSLRCNPGILQCVPLPPCFTTAANLSLVIRPQMHDKDLCELELQKERHANTRVTGHSIPSTGFVGLALMLAVVVIG